MTAAEKLDDGLVWLCEVYADLCMAHPLEFCERCGPDGFAISAVTNIIDRTLHPFLRPLHPFLRPL